jgi:hypothetical protein
VKIQPKKVVLSVAEEWKYDLIENIKNNLEKTRDVGKMMKKVMIKEHTKDVSKIVPTLLKNENKIPKILLSQKQEIQQLKKYKEEIEKEFKLELVLKKNNPKAMPFKPSIQIE